MQPLAVEQVTAPISYSTDELWLARHQPAVLDFIQETLTIEAQVVAKEMAARLMPLAARYSSSRVLSSAELQRALDRPSVGRAGWIREIPLGLSTKTRKEVSRVLGALVTALDVSPS